MTTVVAVNGSRREGSYTRSGLELALEGAAEVGARTDFIDLGAVDLPLYNPDVGDVGPAAALKRRVREADGVLLGTPVYHDSYSSAFRNFHDYCGWDEYEDTVVGLLATAGGGSYGSTLGHMRDTVRGVHGFVVPHQVGIRNASSTFVDDGDGRVLSDDDIRDRVTKLGRVVVEHARRFDD